MKRFLIWFFGIIFLCIILLLITDNAYILKGIRVVYFTGHSTAFIDDYSYFENETILASTHPQPWQKHEDFGTLTPTETLSEANKNYETVAFLIIKNDSLIYEQYADGYGITSQTNSFSMAKSITSALLGKAIQEGYIKNLEQPVSDFYPQFADTDMTVGDLSSMSSGLNWDESYLNPFGITARAYYDDDLAETMLSLKVVDTPGQAFKYLSGNTALLAMVLQKATQQPLSNYLSKSFWQPMGFEQPALWQVDDETNRLVKAYCCLSSNARDFARFGKLYKDFGKWNGKQLIDSSFVAQSIQPRFESSPEYGYGFWLSDYNNKEIFVMRGILGQYVITIPEDDLIIVRLGHRIPRTKIDNFTTDFYLYVDEVYAMLNYL
ncbi:serine hydrolase domain-containing protein [Cochleicola gelatinilyticus]|uniref:Serine hydrolase n=1 Tax=Cochleicola gelatinilyticus TaxID=1763537 RepID=A0A167IZR3_9FLAO|nr:serine hydrolase [Cochleicola gelatinilyticus]OAB80174.1 serine hydrolase [Cochleicola gelatinilyticus]